MYAFLYNTILIIILAIGIAIIITRKEVYKAEKKVLIIFALGNSFYVCYFFLFTISTFSPTPEDIALALWNLSLIFNLLFLILWTSNHILELHKSSKLKYIPLLLFLLLGGIIISQIFLNLILLLIKELMLVAFLVSSIRSLNVLRKLHSTPAQIVLVPLIFIPAPNGIVTGILLIET